MKRSDEKKEAPRLGSDHFSTSLREEAKPQEGSAVSLGSDLFSTSFQEEMPPKEGSAVALGEEPFSRGGLGGGSGVSSLPMGWERWQRDAILGGRYKLLSRLGAGGMGDIWEALDLAHGKRVALKQLAWSLREDARFRQRFVREMDLLKRLHHPSIVKILDLYPEAYCFSMELLKGEDLRKRLLRVGRLPLQQTLSLLIAVLEGLQAAHQASLVHRDIKPENLFLCEDDGRVVLLDFGIAYAAEATQLTSRLAGMGTAYYTAPELLFAKGEPLPAADIYSCGILLYEMLLGRIPTAGASSLVEAYKRLSEEGQLAAPEAPEEIFQDILREITTLYKYYRQAILEEPTKRITLTAWLSSLKEAKTRIEELERQAPHRRVKRITQALQRREYAQAVHLLDDSLRSYPNDAALREEAKLSKWMRELAEKKIQELAAQMQKGGYLEDLLAKLDALSLAPREESLSSPASEQESEPSEGQSKRRAEEGQSERKATERPRILKEAESSLWQALLAKHPFVQGLRQQQARWLAFQEELEQAVEKKGPAGARELFEGGAAWRDLPSRQLEAWQAALPDEEKRIADFLQRVDGDFTKNPYYSDTLEAWEKALSQLHFCRKYFHKHPLLREIERRGELYQSRLRAAKKALEEASPRRAKRLLLEAGGLLAGKPYSKEAKEEVDRLIGEIEYQEKLREQCAEKLRQGKIREAEKIWKAAAKHSLFPKAWQHPPRDLQEMMASDEGAPLPDDDSKGKSNLRGFLHGLWLGISAPIRYPIKGLLFLFAWYFKKILGIYSLGVRASKRPIVLILCCVAFLGFLLGGLYYWSDSQERARSRRAAVAFDPLRAERTIPSPSVEEPFRGAWKLLLQQARLEREERERQFRARAYPRARFAETTAGGASSEALNKAVEQIFSQPDTLLIPQFQHLKAIQRTDLLKLLGARPHLARKAVLLWAYSFAIGREREERHAALKALPDDAVLREGFVEQLHSLLFEGNQPLAILAAKHLARDGEASLLPLFTALQQQPRSKIFTLSLETPKARREKARKRCWTLSQRSLRRLCEASAFLEDMGAVKTLSFQRSEIASWVLAQMPPKQRAILPALLQHTNPLIQESTRIAIACLLASPHTQRALSSTGKTRKLPRESKACLASSALLPAEKAALHEAFWKDLHQQIAKSISSPTTLPIQAQRVDRLDARARHVASSPTTLPIQAQQASQARYLEASLRLSRLVADPPASIGEAALQALSQDTTLRTTEVQPFLLLASRSIASERLPFYLSWLREKREHPDERWKKAAWAGTVSLLPRLREAFSQQAALDVSNTFPFGKSKAPPLALYQAKHRERLWAADRAGGMYLQALLEAGAHIFETDTGAEGRRVGFSMSSLSARAGGGRDLSEDAAFLAAGMPLWVVLLGHLPSAKGQEKILSFFEKEGEACRPWLEEAILLVLEEAGADRGALERPNQSREAQQRQVRHLLLRRLWQSVKASATPQSVKASKDWQLAAYFAAMQVCKLSPAAQSHLLVAALSAKASTLRLAAWEAIFYTPQLLSSLEGALQRDAKGDWRMRLLVARLLGHVPRVSPLRKRLLQRLMRDSHPWVRMAATASWAQQPKRPHR